ncbi:hypothetical protein ABZ721_15230 [Streptomyces sp. NPDC006733]|uniref:hypothetical protein n=1 Tax=Streptomyces sp. NPDC006733 TaxID=3155460 RepID=UPI00340BC4A2
MKKIITSGLLAAAALAAGTPAAFADNDSNFGPGVNAANNWNFTAAAVCFQELAVVPVAGPWATNANNCTNGNVLDHAAQQGAERAGSVAGTLTGGH